MATKKTTVPAATEAALNQAREAGLSLLREAGKLAASAGEARDTARTKGASALDMTIAGLSAPGVMTATFAFDVTDRAGQVIDHVKATLADYIKGFRNADGSASRATEGAFRATMLPLFFNVTGDQSAGAKSVWATFGKALPAAVALVTEGITARIGDDGKLVLEGGEGETAEALRNAKSTSALVKAAKGETGQQGGADSGTNPGEAREATPAEITSAAVRLARIVSKGEATLCNAAMSNLREIARIITANPEAFAED